MEAKGDHLYPSERVKINVGGTIFETSLTTLTRVSGNVLSTMVANRWQNGQELFVDRNPTHFGKVLDYLRDGESFKLPAEAEIREAVRREAEFYNLRGLVEMCSAPQIAEIQVDDTVMWKEDAVDFYWRSLVRFSGEPNIKWHGCASCGDEVESCLNPCHEMFLDDEDKDIRYENWLHIKHQMPFMTGKVKKAGFILIRKFWNSSGTPLDCTAVLELFSDLWISMNQT